MDIEDTNITVVGWFNPFIIQPDWLKKNDIANAENNPEELKFQINSAKLISGGPQTFQFELDGFQWVVGLERIRVGSSSSQSPRGYLDNVLRLLPHTPVRATGNNFRLRWDRNEWKGPVPEPIVSESVPNILGSAQSATLVSKSLIGNATLTLSLMVSDEEVNLDANFHRVADTVEEVSASMQEFDADFDRLRQFVKFVNTSEGAE